MMKTTGKGSPETYFTMTMEGAFITKVSNSGTEEGNVVQKVELVFKTVKIEYKPQDNKTGSCSARQDLQLGHPGRHGLSVGLIRIRRGATSRRMVGRTVLATSGGVKPCALRTHTGHRVGAS